MRYIGIDLAWKMDPRPDERRSAVACLDDKAQLIFYGHFRTDEEIIDALEKLCSVGCMIGVDAPLIVRPDTTGLRACEGMLMEMKVHVMPTDPRRFEQWYGGCRGVVLLEKLKDKDFGYGLVDRLPPITEKAVVETYPTGAWKRLFGETPKFKGVPLDVKRAALLRLKDLLKWSMPPRFPAVRMDVLDRSKKDLEGLGGVELDMFGDALDALMSAYTVLLWDRDPKNCETVGDLKTGLILMPLSPRSR